MSRPKRAAASLACLTWLRDAESDASGSEISSDEGADPDVNSDIDNRQPTTESDNRQDENSGKFLVYFNIVIVYFS